MFEVDGTGRSAAAARPGREEPRQSSRPGAAGCCCSRLNGRPDAGQRHDARRSRSTCTCRGACASVRTATSTRTGAARAACRKTRTFDALLDDLELRRAPAARVAPLISVFFGGGTPSLFSPAVDRADAGARAARCCRCAPASRSRSRRTPARSSTRISPAYRAAGVNRVSLGAQSFDDRHLAALGRIHAAAETRPAVAELRAAGLDNFNLDLMYALPEQDLVGARCRYRARARARARAPVALPAHARAGHGVRAAGRRRCRTRTRASRCRRSASRGWRTRDTRSTRSPRTHVRARSCRHNRNYWEFGDYLGVGAGAHGKLTRRWTRSRARRVTARRRVIMAAATPAARIAEEHVIETGGAAVRVLPQCTAAGGRLRHRDVRSADRRCPDPPSSPVCAECA